MDCRHVDSAVVDSRTDGKTYVALGVMRCRTRVCQKCGKRFKTYEVEAEAIDRLEHALRLSKRAAAPLIKALKALDDIGTG